MRGNRHRDAEVVSQSRVATVIASPPLQMLGKEQRFIVEIKTTAALQHPHIVLKSNSGTAKGFWLYVMPVIGGETRMTC